MTVFVFLGPSLPLATAREILDATYLPPVAMGDLYALVRRRARAGDIVGIIDGFFEQVPAVWHKEVLFALSRGVRVFGASSMGALRAAELHSFGMVGVGRIFEAYRSGEIEDDDEVAVVHGPAEQGYRALSEAMVNVRTALEAAEAAGHVDRSTRDALCRIAKAQHYPYRTWASVLDAGRESGIAASAIESVRRFVRETKPDAKRSDAILLLERLRTEQTTRPDRQAPGFVLEETAYWIGLTQARSGDSRPDTTTAADGPTPTAIVNHVRATSPERDQLWRHALLLRMAADLGDSVPITREELEITTQRFCRRRGLASHAALEQWRVAQQLTKEELRYLLELETRCEILARKHAAEIDAWVVLELKRRGTYADVSATVRALRENLARLGIRKPTLEDAEVDADTLQRWYEERCGRMTTSADKHAEELGFETLRDFVSELLALYLLDRKARPALAGREHRQPTAPALS